MKPITVILCFPLGGLLGHNLYYAADYFLNPYTGLTEERRAQLRKLLVDLVPWHEDVVTKMFEQTPESWRQCHQTEKDLVTQLQTESAAKTSMLEVRKLQLTCVMLRLLKEWDQIKLVDPEYGVVGSSMSFCCMGTIF